MKETKRIEVKIEKAGIDKIEIIYSLLKELAIYESLEDKFMASKDSLIEILFSGKIMTETVLAYYNNLPVGIIAGYYTFSTFAGGYNFFIEDFYVKSEYRCKGIGKKLFDYLAHLARKKKCHKIEWKVLVWNRNAINFYKKIGAYDNEEWIDYEYELN